MYNNYNVYKNNVRQPFDVEPLFPEVYKELYPFVVDAANIFIRSGRTLTRETLKITVDEIIKQTGLWDEDEDMGMDMDVNTSAVYTNQRRFMRRHHNRNTLRDVLEILLLREFFR